MLPSSNWHPVRDRFFVAMAWASMTACGGVLVEHYYSDRTIWFEQYGLSIPILLSTLVAAIFVGWFALVFGLPQRLQKRRMRTIPLVGFGVSCMAVALCWVVSAPSLASVSKSIQEKDFHRARGEIQAYQCVHGKEKGSLVVQNDLAKAIAVRNQAKHEKIDRLHLDKVKSSPDIFEASKYLGEYWHSGAFRQLAYDHLMTRANSSLRQAALHNDVALLKKMQSHFVYVDPTLVHRARVHEILSGAARCIDSLDFECAHKKLEHVKIQSSDTLVSERWQSLREQLIRSLDHHLRNIVPSSKDLYERTRQLEQALRHAELFQALGGEKSHQKVQLLKSQLKRLRFKIERKRKREEAAIIRKAQSGAKKGRSRPVRKKKTRQRKSSRSNRVRCCDGSYSPTCTYSRASFRGCCSHHGGVC